MFPITPSAPRGDTQPTPHSTSAEAATRPQQILQLPAEPVIEPAEADCFDKTQTPACSPRFANVIYATEEKAFWLLPERAANAIKEAAQRLEQDISPDKSAEDRKKGLDANGLLEHFLEPRLSFFLEGEEQAWMQRFESENRFPNGRYINERRDLLTDPRNLAFHRNKERLDTLNQWLGLYNSAISEAHHQGYDYQDGRLFSPQAVAARNAVQAYLEARNALLEQGELPTYTLQEIAELMQEAKRRYDDAIDCTVNCRAQFRSYQVWKEQQQSAFDYAQYIDAILKAADYGLALPEFALISDEHSGVVSGIESFKEYLGLIDAQRRLEQKMEERYQGWIRASGENLQAPAGLLKAEKQAWSALEDQKLQIRWRAQWVVSNTQPRRHLLWEPEQFEPKPVDRLVKVGFPLREVSLPDTPGQPLRHLSLKVLKSLLKPATKRSASFAGNSSGQQGEDHASSDFSDWLKGMGSIEIKDQEGPWFDAEGWFDVERFYQYVSQRKGYRVDALQDAGTRQEWGERLRQVLFQDDAVRQLRLFDPTPQAQLVRCLTPPQPSIHGGASVDGPSFALHEGVTAGARAHFNVDLARGEIELGKIDLPERSAATDVQAAYINYQQQLATMNLGRFSVHLGARAWGYTGVAMMLAAELELSPGNTGYGATLDPVEPAEREANSTSAAGNARTGQVVTGQGAKAQIEDGASASFNLFAGVQVGIKLTGALNWAPPKQLADLRALPAYTDGQAPNDGWLSLARLEGELAAAIGVGAKGEVTLSLDKGCLILRIKAALIAGPGVSGTLAFAVGYEAIIELINLMRRELRENQYHNLEWVEGSAFDFISKLNVLGAVGIDVGMVYMLSLRNADIVMNLYEALTSGGKGGPIAHAITTYKYPSELERWFVDATPESLGPMLMTLLFRPEAFEAIDFVETQEGVQELVARYDEAECHLLQQRAIERILGWLVRNAQQTGTLDNAQRQFDEACSRMNRFGTKEPQPGQAYCTNRMRMDRFMEVKVGNWGEEMDTNNAMRERYRDRVRVLGALRDGYCQRSDYYGRTFVPTGRATYIGHGE
ncbi:hypothetical protein SAMN03159511_1334 [Pseudomonas sp. NFACC19-2]|nr:hypothetical protein [Pseudomonas sp. NFACC19-2]SFW20227.1 hypothetical protein SAMN03159511_1334 [Pseudomonas sp. NFACC19-2]